MFQLLYFGVIISITIEKHVQKKSGEIHLARWYDSEHFEGFWNLL